MFIIASAYIEKKTGTTKPNVINQSDPSDHRLPESPGERRKYHPKDDDTTLASDASGRGSDR